jgi:hypothetical protein
LLIGVGKYWDTSITKPKQQQKLTVQTISLVSTTQIDSSKQPPPQKSPSTELKQPIATVPTKTEPVKEKPVTSRKEVDKPAPTQTVKKTTPVPKEAKKQTTPVKTKVEPTKQTTNKQSNPAATPNVKKSPENKNAELKKEKTEAERKKQQEITVAQEAAKQRELELLSKAKTNLAKMSETRNQITPSPSLNLETTSLPKELGVLQIDTLPTEGSTGADRSAKEAGYNGEVASRLKKGLRLPDYGAVKIKLTLDREGKVISVETISSESSKNRTYVESKIPALLFPPFGQRFKGATQNSFVITLQNDS